MLTPVIVRRLQSHLSQLDKADVLNGMLPGLGHDWMEVLAGSQSVVFQMLGAYVMEWEAVVARWVRDDHALLQPATPGCLFVTAAFCIALMKAKTAKKELQLCAALPTIL